MTDEKTAHISENEDVAFEIVLEKRERSYAYGEPRYHPLMATAALEALDDTAAMFNLTVPTEPEDVRQRILQIQAYDDEVAEIRRVLEEFENLPAEEVLDTHGRLTTDPYTSIANGEAQSVDKAVIKQWVESDAFYAVQMAFGEGDRAEFNQLNIVLIDERTASAQYQIVQGGNTGSSAVIILKGEDGLWRVAVHCQHPVTPKQE